MANFLDNIVVFTSRAQIKIANEAYAAALLLNEGLDASVEIDNVNWWTQLLTGSNDTNQTNALRLSLLTLLVDNARLLSPQTPVGVFGLYQPVSPVVSASVLWGLIQGDINNQGDLIAKFNTYLALAGGTMTGPLLVAPTTRIDASVAGALNIGTVTATTINLGGVGIPINTGTIAQGVWNGTAIGVAYGGLGTLDFASGSNGQVPVKSGAGYAWGNPGLGDFVGPGSSTLNALVRFADTSGKLGKSSPIIVSDAGGIQGAISLSMNGATSGFTVLIPSAIAGSNTQTLQAATGTVALLQNTLGDFATTTSAQLLAKISDAQGTGRLVFDTSPTLTTPIIGAATGTSLSVTGALTSGVASSAAGTLVLRNATNAFTQTIRGVGVAASIIYDLPTTAPTAGQLLSASAPSGGVVTMSWATALSNPMTTSGDMIYGGAAGVATRLAGDTTNTKKFLTATSIAGVAQPPSWGGIVINDLPIITLAKGGTGSALVNPAANRLMGWDNATSAVSFMVIGAGLAYTAATKTLSVDATGIVVSVTGTANRITSTGGSTPVIDISAAYVGQSSITTLGTITTGDWQGAIIDGEFGGTGLDVSTGTIGDSIRVSATNEWEFYTPSGGGGGTVTTVSVVSANGFAGTVATATTTPAITLTTTVTGLLKGNGTAISAATGGTDYVVPGVITGSGLTMATARILGRTTASTGAIEEISVGAGLTLSAGSLVATAVATGNQSFTSQTSITVTHNRGWYPVVQVIDGSGILLSPLSVTHASVNSFTVTLSSSTTGNIIYA